MKWFCVDWRAGQAGEPAFGFVNWHLLDRDHADRVADVWIVNRESAVFFAAVVEEAGSSGIGVGVLHGLTAVGAVVGIEGLILCIKFEQPVDDGRDLRVECILSFIGRRIGSVNDDLRLVDDRIAGFSLGLAELAEDFAGIFGRNTLRLPVVVGLATVQAGADADAGNAVETLRFVIGLRWPVRTTVAPRQTLRFGRLAAACGGAI